MDKMQPVVSFMMERQGKKTQNAAEMIKNEREKILAVSGKA